MAQGTREELIASGTTRHRMVLDGDAGWVREFGGVTVADVAGNTAVVEHLDDQARQALLSEAMRRGSVQEFGPIRPTLTEIYRKVTAQ